MVEQLGVRNKFKRKNKCLFSKCISKEKIVFGNRWYSSGSFWWCEGVFPRTKSWGRATGQFYKWGRRVNWILGGGRINGIQLEWGKVTKNNSIAIELFSVGGWAICYSGHLWGRALCSGGRETQTKVIKSNWSEYQQFICILDVIVCLFVTAFLYKCSFLLRRYWRPYDNPVNLDNGLRWIYIPLISIPPPFGIWLWKQVFQWTDLSTW